MFSKTDSSKSTCSQSNFSQSKITRLWATVVVLSAALLLPGCGGGTTEKPRVATNSANKQGLWRMTEEFQGETFYSTVLIQGTGTDVNLTDCSRAFEVDKIKLSGSSYAGFNYDLAPLQVLNNDSLRWTYNNQIRNYQKMDVNAQFSMGSFTLKSSLLPDVVASNLVCVQFSETAQGEVLVLSTQVLGNPLVITINMKNGFQQGVYKVEPYGNERVMAIFSGAHWVKTTLMDFNEISSGTLNITSRGQVWIKGELKGVLRDGVTPVTVTFNAETPVN